MQKISATTKKLTYKHYYKITLWLPIFIYWYLALSEIFRQDRQDLIDILYSSLFLFCLAGGLQYIVFVYFATRKINRTTNKKELIPWLYLTPLILVAIQLLPTILLANGNFTIKINIISLFLILFYCAYILVIEVIYWMYVRTR